MKKTYVIDTNVPLTDSRAIFSFQNNNIIIPLKVLEEIDKFKKRQDGVGANARSFIRILDNYRQKGSLYKGVRMGKGKGIISVRTSDLSHIPADLDKTDADNQIIATAIGEKKQFPRRKVIVVSRDINMRVKCDSLEMPSEDFITDQVVRSTSELYKGVTSHLVDDQFIDQFYIGQEKMYLEKDEGRFFPNQYIMLVSNQNQKKTALAKFKSYSSPLVNINDYTKTIWPWGLKPKNKEQMFALDLLMNPEVPIVSIIGQAGCGKTLLALAAGLEQVVEKKNYNKLIVSKPVQPLGGQDIGFLPGTLEDKMKPWLMPVQDNLDFLLHHNTINTDLLFQNGTIEIEALTYIRGRSISNAFIIIDEAQNLTPHEIKTIITRVGVNTKIVLTGDIEQIDNIYLDATSNGLSNAIEKFKKEEIAGHITLLKGERSKVASLAAKVL